MKVDDSEGWNVNIYDDNETDRNFIFEIFTNTSGILRINVILNF